MGSPTPTGAAFPTRSRSTGCGSRRPFYLGAYEVTQAQYRAVTGENPSGFKGSDDLPVEQVSWYDAIAFCNTLSAKEGLTPYYQLGAGPRSGGGRAIGCRRRRSGSTPAARAARRDTSSETTSARLGDHAWSGINSGDKTHPGRPEAGECVRPPRHARERVGVVRRRIRPQLLRAIAVRRPAWTLRIHSPSGSRWRLGGVPSQSESTTRHKRNPRPAGSAASGFELPARPPHDERVSDDCSGSAAPFSIHSRIFRANSAWRAGAWSGRRRGPSRRARACLR